MVLVLDSRYAQEEAYSTEQDLKYHSLKYAVLVCHGFHDINVLRILVCGCQLLDVL